MTNEVKAEMLDRARAELDENLVVRDELEGIGDDVCDPALKSILLEGCNSAIGYVRKVIAHLELP